MGHSDRSTGFHGVNFQLGRGLATTGAAVLVTLDISDARPSACLTGEERIRLPVSRCRVGKHARSGFVSAADEAGGSS